MFEYELEINIEKNLKLPVSIGHSSAVTDFMSAKLSSMLPLPNYYPELLTLMSAELSPCLQQWWGTKWNDDRAYKQCELVLGLV